MFNFKRYYFYISDFLLAVFTFLAVFAVRYSSGIFSTVDKRQLSVGNFFLFCGYAAVILIFNTAMKLYELNRLSRRKESFVNAYLSVAACAFTCTFLFYLLKYDFARFVFFISLTIIPVIQVFSHKALFQLIAQQSRKTEIYYLGTEKNLQLLYQLLEQYHNVIPSHVVVLKNITEINKNSRKKSNQIIVIDPCFSFSKEGLSSIYEYELAGYKLCSIADLFEYLDQSLPAELVSETQMELFSLYKVQTVYNRFFKRIGDIFISIFLMIILSPLFILTATLIKLTSRGSVFYHQKRVGLYNKEFVMHKFRTMQTNAEKGKAMLTVKGDTRITAIGKIIRPLRIDELPQLVNIFKGEMSFIGPRPERLELMEEITAYHPLFCKRLLVKPGLTGWAQVKFQYANSIEEMNKKLSYDLYYIKSISFLFDLKIMLYTIETVIFKRGAL